MKRHEFPKPVTTCLVDLNSVEAYGDRGLAARKYPRLLPIPYTAICGSSETLWLEPWRKNLKMYPQIFFMVARDIPAKSDGIPADAVLGVGLGLAFSDDGIVAASKDPSPRDQKLCYWYSLYSDNSQVLAQEMTAGVNVRDLKITIESPSLGKHVFDQGKLLFDPVELLNEMNILIPYKKYDLISLGAADAPIHVPIHKKFIPGEEITISCPELGELKIGIEDQRDPHCFINGWSPRPYFLGDGYH